MSPRRVLVILLAFFIFSLFGFGHLEAGTPDEAQTLTQRAVEALGEGRHDDALALANEAQAIWEKNLPADDPVIALILNLQAKVHDATGRYDQAEPIFRRALEIDRKAYGSESTQAASDLNSLGRTLFFQGRYDQAEPLYREALAIREKLLGPDHLHTAVSLNNLASLLQAMGRYKDAEPLFDRALRIRENKLGPDNPAVATTLSNLASLYEETGRYKQAQEGYLRVLSIQRSAYGPDHPELATTLNNLAYLLDATGDYLQAESLYRESLAIREKALGPDHPDTAVSLNNLGELLCTLGEYEQAEALYNRALDIRRRMLGPEHPAVAQSLNNLAQAYEYKGDFSRSERLYAQALAIWEKTYGPNHPETAAAVNNLAEYYRAIGDLDRAEPLCERSLAIRQSVHGPEHPTVAVAVNNLAGLKETRKKFDEAEALYRRAIDIWTKAFGPDNPNTAMGLSNLAALYFTKGQIEKGRELDERALAIRKAVFGPDHPEVALSLNNLAGHHFAAGEKDQAEALYREALRIGEKAYGATHPTVAVTLGNLAAVAAYYRDFKTALGYLRRIQDIDSRLIDDVMGFTSEDQKMNFLTTLQSHLFAWFTLALKLGDDPQVREESLNLWLRRKGIVLEAQKRFREALLYGGDPKAMAVFQELSRTRAALSRLIFAGPGADPEGYEKKMETLRGQAHDLETELSRLSRNWAARKRTGKADARSLAVLLPEGSALLDFARYRPFAFEAPNTNDRWLPARYLAFVLKPGATGGIRVVEVGDAEAIDRAVSEFKRRVTDRSDEEGLETGLAAGRLYDLVFKPLLPALAETREIFVSPDGPLNLIPFEILQDPEGRYLIDRYLFNYLSAGRDLSGPPFDAPDRLALDKKPAVLLGDPDFDLSPAGSQAEDGPAGHGGLRGQADAAREPGILEGLRFAPLAGAREEVRAIADLFGPERTRVYVGREVTEDLLQSLDAPPILHLATHGFFFGGSEPDAVGEGGTATRSGGVKMARINPLAGNPLLMSGLALAGANRSMADRRGTEGILTAEKVLSLRLRGAGLVVLSACETGLGEVKSGEGVFGLRRAFNQVGVGGLVMSMWAVPDQETKELMTAFYRNILNGLKPGPALREAARAEKAAAEARYGQGHPLFWGAFIYSGFRNAAD